MKYLLWPLKIIYCIYALVWFVVLMLFVVPFVLVGSLLGTKKGGDFIYKACKVWGYTWYSLVGITHKSIYEAPHDTGKKYIFVANHISYMDIPPVVVALNQPIRVLGKYEMVHYPVFGYIYRCAVILVDRSSTQTRAESVRHLKEALAKHISIVIFPEGTFNTTGKPLKDFYEGAFRIAIETQTPIKPLLFVDTIDRLHYRSIFTLTPGPNRVVFMNEVSVAGMQINDLPILKEKVHAIMEAGLRKYRTYNEKTVGESLTAS